MISDQNQIITQLNNQTTKATKQPTLPHYSTTTFQTTSSVPLHLSTTLQPPNTTSSTNNLQNAVHHQLPDRPHHGPGHFGRGQEGSARQGLYWRWCCELPLLLLVFESLLTSFTARRWCSVPRRRSRRCHWPPRHPRASPVRPSRLCS